MQVSSEPLTTVSPDLSLKPLGAGDLIDRAVRFYRKNVAAFLLIAAPPVLVGTLFSVGWTLLGRALFAPETYSTAGQSASYYVFTWLGGIVIWLTEVIATLVVMGGASRNFVRHLLFGEPISVKETYRNVSRRLLGLIAASSTIGLGLGCLGIFFFYFLAIFIAMAVVLIVAVLQAIPALAVVVSVAAVIAGAYGGLWLFFLIASRFAYVPQVMLVEGQGVFAAISRSAGLASGNSRRLMALFVFTIVATLSALAILYVPIGWYAWAEGISLTSDAELLPAWIEIAYSLVWQISFILLSPVWTIGLCLLYVDERVRSEGYDIELMAARRLGDIPTVPREYVNPLQPALGSVVAPPIPTLPAADAPAKSSSILGLD